MATEPPPIGLSSVNGFAERILAGETVFGLVKANRAHTISGRALILYDDGTNDLAQLGDFLTGSAYAVETWPPTPEPFKATKDGFVVSVMVQQSNRDSGVIQRGEVFVTIQVGSDQVTGRSICWGWVFSKGGFLSLSTREFEGGPNWPISGGGTVQLNFTITRTVAGTFLSDIVPGNNSEFVLQHWSLTATGTATLAFFHEISLNNTVIATYNSIASGANSIASGPQTATNSATSSQIADSTDPYSRLVAGTESAQISQGTGGATDALLVVIDMRIKGAIPIVTNAGTGTYTVTAGSIVPNLKG